MITIKRTTKELVRQYLAQRNAEKSAPPSMEEIRRQLGWGLADTPRHQ